MTFCESSAHNGSHGNILIKVKKGIQYGATTSQQKND